VVFAWFDAGKILQMWLFDFQMWLFPHLVLVLLPPGIMIAKRRGLFPATLIFIALSVCGVALLTWNGMFFACRTGQIQAMMSFWLRTASWSCIPLFVVSTASTWIHCYTTKQQTAQTTDVARRNDENATGIIEGWPPGR
jgi:hypothetical protein